MKQNKSAKRSLLFSVLSLLLCCTMLAGTTFAWFTDSVTSGNNKIVAGNLDVELYHSNKTVTDDKVTATTALFQQTLWEPGVAVFENLKVANEGTLALKYQLMINFTNAVKTPEGKTLADVLKVGVVEGGVDVAGTRDAVVGAVKTWEPLATFVLEEALEANASDTYGIVIWWEPSDVDNDFNMNNENKNIVLTIDLGVSLIATQVDAESDAFGKDYDASTTLPELIQDNEELKDALTADVEHIVVNLTNDVTWDVAAWANNAMGGASTKTITINAHGYTINFNHTNSDWNNITAGDGIVLTINNAHITNSGYNNGPWNRHDLNFACEVVLNDVTTDKALAFKNSATLNNVTISDANTSDTYAIWVQPVVEGQTITLNNCVIDMLDCTDGRGIKIDNQYVNAADEKLVTLNVSNTTFKTEEKSAILVKTTLGANITLNNVDIANTPDPVHAVWVDEDAEAAYDFVTVTGGEKYYEGDVVSSAADLSDILASGETNIVLAPGGYSMPTTNSDVTIIGGRDTIITIDKPKADKVTLQGVTVVGSGNYTGIQHSNTVVFEDCLIKGVQFLYAEKVIFNNCTFDLTEKADYIWTYGAKDVEFNNCTFNTAGKALLIYSEDVSLVTNVSVKGCTFNATASALASGNVAAAIEIDSSLSTNGHYTLTTQNNTVDSDFCGEWRIKKSGSNNTTVNGTVYNAVTIDGKLVAYTAADLQKILDAAADGTTVYFANDIVGDVTATQKPDVKVTIDGNGYTLAGAITVNGKSARYETAGLTIQNVNFVADSLNADAYINLGKSGDDNTRYTNNVTVKNCTFSYSGEADVVAVKSYTGGDWNLTFDGCTVNAGMHSALQLANVEKGLKVVGCEIYSKNGINLNYTPSLEMSGCTVDVQGYAVRFGVNGSTNNGTFSIADSTLKSANDDGDAVIILRGTMTGATLTLTNTTLIGTPDITGNANIVR